MPACLARVYAPNPYTESPSSRASAREKLTRLTKLQFQELSTDVYDELIRRMNAESGSPEHAGEYKSHYSCTHVDGNPQFPFCQCETTSTPKGIRRDKSSRRCLGTGSRISRVMYFTSLEGGIQSATRRRFA